MQLRKEVKMSKLIVQIVATFNLFIGIILFLGGIKYFRNIELIAVIPNFSNLMIVMSLSGTLLMSGTAAIINLYKENVRLKLLLKTC